MAPRRRKKRQLSLEKFLAKTYYDIKNPAGFASVQKLQSAAESAGYENGTRVKVQKWLTQQETYGLTKPARRRFPRSPVLVAGLDSRWEADLMDLTSLAKYNDKFRYVLVVLDVFSRYCWTRTLKTKTSAEVAEAFVDIFKEGRQPKDSLRTDKGMEFCGRKTRIVLKERGIHHILTYNETQAGYCERLIKTLKGKAFKYMLHNQTHRWIDVMKDITTTYNNTVHRSLGMKPTDVNGRNESEVRYKQYKLKHPPAKKEVI